MLMRVKYASTRFIDNLPASVQYSLGDAQVLQYREFLRETRSLPNASPNGRVRIREVIETVTQTITQRRVLDQSLLAINGFKHILPFKRTLRFGKLPTVYSAHPRIFEIGQHRGKPRRRGRYGILGKKNQDLT